MRACQCHLGKGHTISVKKTRLPRTMPSLPVYRLHWEMGLWCPVLAGKEVDPRANRRETELGTLRQLRGRRSGQEGGGGVFGAWQVQGLIAGAALGLTLAPALEIQAGTTGQAWVTPSPTSLDPPKFPEFRAGFFWTVAGNLTQPPWAPRRHQPGKWDRSGWPSATCRHTWCGTHGCKEELGAAAAPRSH